MNNRKISQLIVSLALSLLSLLVSVLRNNYGWSEEGVYTTSTEDHPVSLSKSIARCSVRRNVLAS